MVELWVFVDGHIFGIHSKPPSIGWIINLIQAFEVFQGTQLSIWVIILKIKSSQWVVQSGISGLNDDIQSTVVAMQFVNENRGEVAHLNQYV